MNIPEELKEFYDTLLKKQEPLGYEFEKLLHDNLWELYEE